MPLCIPCICCGRPIEAPREWMLERDGVMCDLCDMGADA